MITLHNLACQLAASFYHAISESDALTHDAPRNAMPVVIVKAYMNDIISVIVLITANTWLKTVDVKSYDDDDDDDDDNNNNK